MHSANNAACAYTVGMALLCRRFEYRDRRLAHRSSGLFGFGNPDDCEAPHDVCGYLPSPACVSLPFLVLNHLTPQRNDSK